MTERGNHITIFSVGHSTHTYEGFLALLRHVGVTAVADVRTSPYSRHYSHFNREVLKDELKLDKIAYSFLGKELGGRPRDREFYCEGVADYEKMATSDDFKKGIDRLIEGSTKYKIAMMCSERDPLDCHRCLLVGRALAEKNISVKHVLSNGKVVNQIEVEKRLLELASGHSDDLLVPKDERLADAYRQRARRVAFSEARLAGPSDPIAAE